VNEDSSFHLNAPDSAVVMCTVSILLEHGTPTISLEIEGLSRSLIFEHRFQRIDTAAKHIEVTCHHNGTVQSDWRRSRY
jgi:hypothetical protein